MKYYTGERRSKRSRSIWDVAGWHSTPEVAIRCREPKGVVGLIGIAFKGYGCGMDGGAELKAAVEQLKTEFLKQLKVEHDRDVLNWGTELGKHNKCYSDASAKFATGGVVAKQDFAPKYCKD